MILSRDLFKDDFQPKKRYRNVYNSRPNDIGLGSYGARNPVIYNDKPCVASVIKNVKPMKDTKLKTKNVSHCWKDKRHSRYFAKPAVQEYTAEKTFNNASTRCISTMSKTMARS